MIARRGKLKDAPQPAATKRVAIYTRKSTDEGLHQEFNSLDAQRQAVEAFIASQRGEGWAALPEAYDDPGFTGANTNRPAFQRLIADVAAGKIDVVAVYKLDRLSRSLSDFVRTLAAFDQHGVAFVSITQNFNTTTSMGRFTVNMLATFAEFEREQISERTADKMRAARRRGMFVGGRPVLGFDVVDKKLVINKPEAEQVRKIFDAYLKHGSLLSAADEINRVGMRTKRHVAATGRVFPGGSFNKHSLRAVLSSALYIGKVEFGGELHAGQHEAIVDERIWAAAQEQLRNHTRTAASETRNRWGALLKGLVFCGVCGHALSHAFTKKGTRIHRYYVCQTQQKQGAHACPGSRAPAGELEGFVVAKIRTIGTDQQLVRATIDAAHRAAETKKPEIAAELRQIENDTRQRSAERKNLLDAIATGTTSPALTERLAALDAAQQQTEQRAQHLRTELVAIETHTIDEADLRDALTAFDPVWDELFPSERARILALLIERVAFSGKAGTMEITFRADGVKSLANQHGRRTA